MAAPAAVVALFWPMMEIGLPEGVDEIGDSPSLAGPLTTMTRLDDVTAFTAACVSQ